MKKNPNFFTQLLVDEAQALVEFSRKYKITTVLLVAFALWGIVYFRPFFDEPIVLTTDDVGTEWHEMAEGIAAYLKPHGVEVELMPSHGTLNNLERLIEEDGKVNAGFLLAPAINPADASKLYSLGSMDYEPIWIFYRKSPEVKISEIRDLHSYRVGLGLHTTGSYVLSKNLLALNGVNVENNSNFISDKRSENVKRLKNGEIDAIIMAAGVIDKTVQKLLHDPSIEVFSFNNSEAYAHLTSYYKPMKILAGSIDLLNYLPNKDIDLIAVTSTLAVRKDMNPGEQLALLLGAQDFAAKNNVRMYAKPKEFPAYVDHAIQLSPIAKNFYDSGPPGLLQHLPFKLAIFLNRFWALLVAIAFVGSLQITFSLSGTNFKLKLRALLKELIELDRQLHEPSLTKLELGPLSQRVHEIFTSVRAMKVPIGAESDYLSLIDFLELLRMNLNRQEDRLTERH
jgi:TRAP-type uncharacterized transport system substrate-binding protein